MPTYLILRRAAWSSLRELAQAAGLAGRVDRGALRDRVRWIRSYMVREPNGRFGLICIFQGVDEAALREHAQQAGLPADEIIPVGETIVLRDDPAAPPPCLSTQPPNPPETHEPGLLPPLHRDHATP